MSDHIKPSFSLDMSWELYGHLVAELCLHDVQALQINVKITFFTLYNIFIDQLPGLYPLPSMGMV